VPGKRGDVNELLPFLTFVERHPAGTSVNAIVDHYSSHGAYVKVGDVMGYVPLRLMAQPAPRSAREFVKVGEAITLVVEKFVPEKRSVDLAVPGMGSAPMVDAKPVKATKPRKSAAKKGAEAEPVVEAVVLATPDPAPVAPKRGAKKAPAPVPAPAPADAPAAIVESAAPKRAAKKAAAPVAPVAVVTPIAKAAPVKKAAAKKAAPVAKAAPAKKVAPAKKAASAKKAVPAKKAVAKKSES
jgi:hypothetical protein